MNITNEQIKRFSIMEPSELEHSLKQLPSSQLHTVIHKCKEIIGDSFITEAQGIWEVLDTASWIEVNERLSHAIVYPSK